MERESELLDAETTPGRNGRTGHQRNKNQHSIYPGHHHPKPEAGSTTRSVEGLGPVVRRLDRVSTNLAERVDLDRRTRDRSSPDPGSGLPYEPATRRASRTGSCPCSIAAARSLSRPADTSFRVRSEPRTGPVPSIQQALKSPKQGFQPKIPDVPACHPSFSGPSTCFRRIPSAFGSSRADRPGCGTCISGVAIWPP